jgi:hypothetical protein
MPNATHSTPFAKNIHTVISNHLVIDTGLDRSCAVRNSLISGKFWKFFIESLKATLPSHHHPAKRGPTPVNPKHLTHESMLHRSVTAPGVSCSSTGVVVVGTSIAGCSCFMAG